MDHFRGHLRRGGRGRGLAVRADQFRRGPAARLISTLALAAVPLGWLTVHMMAAIHYAHLYWQPDETCRGRKDRRPANMSAGWTFPGGKEPGGYEFLYFSYVIGMTAQTSDTAYHQYRNAQD